jgi:hypothetical protein
MGRSINKSIMLRLNFFNSNNVILSLNNTLSCFEQQRKKQGGDLTLDKKGGYSGTTKSHFTFQRVVCDGGGIDQSVIIAPAAVSAFSRQGTGFTRYESSTCSLYHYAVYKTAWLFNVHGALYR